MTVHPVIVLPAPPHPTARNTAARYYAALVGGLAAAGAPPHVLAIDDGSSADAAAWAAEIPHVDLTVYAPDPVRRDLPTRTRRIARPMFDAAPQALARDLDRRLAEGYDVLHVEEFHLGRLSAGRRHSLLSVLHSEARDVRAQRAHDFRSRLRDVRVLRAERVILQRQRHIRVISAELERDVRAAGVDVPVDVIPLSLDLRGYEFQPTARPDVVGLIGSMRWPPTRAAALRLLQTIWPKVRERCPDAKLVVAGWDAESLRVDADVDESVTLLSDLADHREFFDRVGILAFPLSIGSGMKVKVLEAMAMGVAVVTTAAGVEGLEATEEAWYEGESADELAGVIVEALADTAAREARAVRARRLVEQQCGQEVVARRMIQLFERIRRGGG